MYRIRNLSIVLFLCFSLLTGCFGYPRILDYPVEGGDRGLNSLSAELDPQISGHYIVFTSDRQGSQNVYLFDIIKRNLVDLPGLNSLDTLFSHPSISDNGQWIVFAAIYQGRSDIYLYNRETRQSENLTAHLASEVRNPTISANGSKIAFEYSNNGHWDVLVYDTLQKQFHKIGEQ